ncbi:MAG: PTS sugar transporter subunit IIA [Elusimicrobiota bacterium]
MINLIIVTHGEFGAYLVEAAEGVVGGQESGIASIGISSRVTVDEVSRRLKCALREMTGSGGIIIMTDMPGGTPCNVTLPLVRERDDVRVISGVNLYMLVTAFNSRKTLSLAALAEKLIVAGKRSVADLNSLLAAGK